MSMSGRWFAHLFSWSDAGRTYSHWRLPIPVPVIRLRELKQHLRLGIGAIDRIID